LIAVHWLFPSCCLQFNGRQGTKTKMKTSPQECSGEKWCEREPRRMKRNRPISSSHSLSLPALSSLFLSLCRYRNRTSPQLLLLVLHLLPSSLISFSLSVPSSLRSSLHSFSPPFDLGHLLNSSRTFFFFHCIPKSFPHLILYTFLPCFVFTT